jgi:hypothetical protein
MLEAVPATPLKPNTAAISAITKNVIAQLNIMIPPFLNSECRKKSVDVDSLPLLVTPVSLVTYEGPANGSRGSAD